MIAALKVKVVKGLRLRRAFGALDNLHLQSTLARKSFKARRDR
jgi:hypothetical protein